MSLGASRAGFRVVAGVDTDSRAIAAHKKNFPNSRHIERDVVSLSAPKILNLIPERFRRIDGVVGGPPCQGFSTIGARDIADPRNRLFLHFFRLVCGLKPIFFVCENVPGILNPQYDEVRKSALRSVERNYRLLSPLILRASDYGAPTSRKRVFFIGVSKSSEIALDKSDFNPPEDVERVYVAQALKGLRKNINPDWQSPDEGWRKVGPCTNGRFGARLSATIPSGVGDKSAIEKLKTESRVSGCLGTIHRDDVIARFDALNPGQKDEVSRTCRLNAKAFCPTIRAGTGSDKGSHQALRPVHPTEPRMITPREAARLQGFPDWFQFDDTKWHSFRQIGNSVSPILAEAILCILFESVNLAVVGA